MDGKIVNISDARHKRNQSLAIQGNYGEEYNLAIHLIDLENEYFMLLKRLSTTCAKFKYPTILSQYKKDMNPVVAIHQEYQSSMLAPSESFAPSWVIDTTLELLPTIIESLKYDTLIIQDFINKYEYILETHNGEVFCHIKKLLKSLERALKDFQEI